jgi:lysophospholipase L1-like esterase
LGDSYTIGEGVDPALRWPVRLAERLRSAGVAIATPEIVARTGWTTSELAVGIDGATPQGPFDIVTLLIGVNDQFRGRPVELFRQGFNSLLQRAIAFAGDSPSTVVVVSIPDWGVTPFASGMDRGRIAAEIDLYNQTAREETVLSGARFIDITGISREAETDLELLGPDRLHPSGVMYGRWVDLIVPVAVEILE